MSTDVATIEQPTTQSQQPARDRWLFSGPVDLAVFLGSALLALGLLAVGARFGLLHAETPEWTWVTAILLIDVAHVYATAFRVYFDPQELRRRPVLYGGVPLLCFAGAAVVYQLGNVWFWRVLAYFAVFHFVRQQYGWVMLYRAKLGERNRWGRRLDSAAIYLATIYPLVYWHAHLPRGFVWFVQGDFGRIPEACELVLRPVYWSVLAAYFAKSAFAWTQGRWNPGKDVVLLTTAVCWYVGIVTFNSDYAFTVTNVIIHGVPYMALVFFYVTARREQQGRPVHSPFRLLVLFLATIWLLAYVEELVWHRAIYHERAWLFGDGIDVGMLQAVLVPLLAVPQLAHYVLDGFVWKRRNNPGFGLVGRR